MAAIDALNARLGMLEDAANLRAGLIAATIINANPYRKKGSKTVKPTDFFRKPTKPQTPEEMMAVLNKFAEQQNRIHSA